MANIKLHKFQEKLLKEFEQNKNATVRFIGDMDIMSMYTHTIITHFIAPPSWTLTDFTELDKLQREELEASFIYNHQEEEWGTPVAVATCTDSRTDRIQAELHWINENTQSCVQLYHTPFMDMNTFLFYDWAEALAFKLAWVDK